MKRVCTYCLVSAACGITLDHPGHPRTGARPCRLTDGRKVTSHPTGLSALPEKSASLEALQQQQQLGAQSQRIGNEFKHPKHAKHARIPQSHGARAAQSQARGERSKSGFKLVGKLYHDWYGTQLAVESQERLISRQRPRRPAFLWVWSRNNTA